MLYENENTEFKSALTGDIYKEVIAFANNAAAVSSISESMITETRQVLQMLTRRIQGSRTGYVTRSHRMLRCSANTH